MSFCAVTVDTPRTSKLLLMVKRRCKTCNPTTVGHKRGFKIYDCQTTRRLNRYAFLKSFLMVKNLLERPTRKCGTRNANERQATIQE